MKSTSASTETATISSAVVVTDDWESFVSDTPTTTTKHFDDDHTQNHHYETTIGSTTTNTAASPWEDASYTLVTSSPLITIPNRPPNDPQRPYFGRFTRNSNNSSSRQPYNNTITNQNNLENDGTALSPTAATSTFWTREYNLSHALQYTERMTLQLRSAILYMTSIWDLIWAIIITIYIICIWYHQHSTHISTTSSSIATTTTTTKNVNIEDDIGATHSNYVITTILMTGLILHTIVWYIRCAAILCTTAKHYHYSNYDDWDYYCHFWFSRIVTIVLILSYMISSIILLVTWNILHLSVLRQFLLFPSNGPNDDSNDASRIGYNIHSYWLFHPTLIRYIQNHHLISYLYLLFLSCGIIEMIRYVILQSYFTTILSLHHQDNDNRIPRHSDDEYQLLSSMEESLLPSRLWYEENDLPSTTTSTTSTTTSTWRTTTLNHDYFGWKWRNTSTSNAPTQQRQSSTVTNRRNDQILDPVQFQTMQEEWNYRKEIYGPYWWSQE